MKRFVAGALCALLLLSLSGAVFADEWNGYSSAKLLAPDVHVYDAPTPEANHVYTLIAEDMFDILGEEAGWLEVLYSIPNIDAAQTGWIPIVAAEYLAALPDNENAPRRIEIISQTLTLRETPDTDAKALASLPTGARAYILEEQGEWYRVKYLKVGDGYEELEGWLLSAYTLEAPRHVYLKAESVAYAYPSPVSPLVGLLDPGTSHTVIGEVPGYWVISLRGASAFLPGSAVVATDEDLIGF